MNPAPGRFYGWESEETKAGPNRPRNDPDHEMIPNNYAIRGFSCHTLNILLMVRLIFLFII